MKRGLINSTALPDCQPFVLQAINDELEVFFTNGRIIEIWLNDCCSEIEKNFSVSNPVCWLLLARLTEATLLTAGNYADAGEFAAAGDLLVNPRKIDVYFKDSPRPVRKYRHGRISDQFNSDDQPHGDFIRWFSRNAVIQQTEPPLLPYLITKLEASEFISDKYLSACRVRMNKIADTIVFLMSWGISSFEDLASRQAGCNAQTAEYIQRHLCRFKVDRFMEIGEKIRWYENVPVSAAKFKCL